MRGGAAEGLGDPYDREAQPGHPRTQERVYGDSDRQGRAGIFQEERVTGMHRAENLIGQNVVSRQGNDLGSIDDLVISEHGQVEFIILSRGGVLGVGGNLVPIPWEAANLQRGKDDLLMTDISEQQLEGAPTFDDYARFGTQDYEQEVHSYFGTEMRTDR